MTEWLDHPTPRESPPLCLDEFGWLLLLWLQCTESIKTILRQNLERR
jgi:hypothetical protein